MALATQCPHCHTKFRVAADQLKLRGGIVRCGACQGIFNGNVHLVGEPAAPAPAPVEQPEALPVYTLDLSHTFDPLGILPGVEAEPAPVSSHPMAAPAAPFAPGGPQVWRTAAKRQAEPEADISHALPDAAAGVPEAVYEPVHAATGEQPSYAPSGRVEPRLESVALADAEPAPVVPPLREPVPLPAGPAPSFVPRDRIEPSFDLPVDEEIVAQALPSFDDDMLDLDTSDGPTQGVATPDVDTLDLDTSDVTAPGVDTPGVATPGVDTPGPAAPGGNTHGDDTPGDAAPHSALQPEPEPPAPVPLQPAAVGDIAAAALPLRASTGIEAPAPGAAAGKTARARAADARARRSSLKPSKIEPPRLRLPQDDADEPEFVKRSRRLERTGRTRNILLGLGAGVLVLVLLAQLVMGFGNGLAARNPGLKPVLAGACAVLGCRIELPSQVANLSIETGELATLAPDTYSLNTLLRNQGTLVQAWPSIELELTDDANKPVLRRVFGPKEYLPPGTSSAAGFGPRSEQPIRLHFSLADVKPSDYHLFVFYP